MAESSESAASTDQQPTAKKWRRNIDTTTWEDKACVIDMADSFMCLICEEVMKYSRSKNDAATHFKRKHWQTEAVLNVDKAKRDHAISTMKSQLLEKVAACPIVNYDMDLLYKVAFKITYQLAKNGKSLRDGDTIQKLLTSVISDLIELCETRAYFHITAKALPLSFDSMVKYVSIISSNLKTKLIMSINECTFYSILIGSYKSSLIISIRMVFEDLSIKEEILEIESLSESADSVSLYDSFVAVIEKNELFKDKMSSVMLDTSSEYIENTADEFMERCQKANFNEELKFYKCLMNFVKNYMNMLNTIDVIRVVNKTVAYMALTRPTTDLTYKLKSTNRLVRVVTFHENLTVLKDLLEKSPSFNQLVHLKSPKFLIQLSIYADLAYRILLLIRTFENDKKCLWESVDSLDAFNDEISLCISLLEVNQWPEMFSRTKSMFQNLKVYLADEKDMVQSYLKTLVSHTKEALGPHEQVMSFSKNIRQPLSGTKDTMYEYCCKTKITNTDVVLREFNTMQSYCRAIGLIKNSEDAWKLAQLNMYPNLLPLYQKHVADFPSGYFNSRVAVAIDNAKNLNKFEHLTDTVYDLAKIRMSSFTPDYDEIMSYFECDKD